MLSSVFVQLLTALATAMLLTSLFALKFRYWGRPRLLAGYFVFFGALEWVGYHYFLPEDAMGPWLAYLFFFLTIPVVGAIVVIRRLEQKHERSPE
jgi:hypothetical protein